MIGQTQLGGCILITKSIIEFSAALDAQRGLASFKDQ